MKVVLSVFLFFLSASVYGEEADCVVADSDILSTSDDPHFNVVLGISPFIGLLGMEAQIGKHAIGIGLPASVSYRYYSSPYRDTMFFGVYYRSYSFDDVNEKVDGIRYSDLKRTHIGIGIGYRWQWQSGWNISTSISFEHYDEEYSNPGQGRRRTEKGTIPFPGINGGYKF